MMTSRNKLKEIVEAGGPALTKLKEYLAFKILEETERLVEAPVEKVAELQGRIKAFKDFEADLLPVPESTGSNNPY